MASSNGTNKFLNHGGDRRIDMGVEVVGVHIDDRFITRDLSPHPLIVAGVVEWEAECAEE